MKHKLEIALQLALRVHAGQTDKAGAPYITHPLRLMQRFNDETRQIVALLHDVLEDSREKAPPEQVSEKDLLGMGFSREEVDAIVALTRQPGESYSEFIARCAKNSIARDVKKEDIQDNLNVLRLDALREADLKRIAKYHQAWRQLRKAV